MVPPGAGRARPSRDSEEFSSQVQTMFDRIAGVYDRMNHVMTAGLDRRWRERAVDLADLDAGAVALDVCCGTGDLTFELARRVGPRGRVVGCDFSERMLELARTKEEDMRLAAGGFGGADANGSGDGLAPVEFEWADALELPYANDSFDAVTVGFGVRNLVDLPAGLAELTRVLRPGGLLVILEITKPQRPPLSSFFSLWFDRVVPLLGSVAGDADAYSYLPASVRSFPPPERLAELMDDARLERIRWLLLAGGIIAIHSGAKRGVSGA